MVLKRVFIVDLLMELCT